MRKIGLLIFFIYFAFSSALFAHGSVNQRHERFSISIRAKTGSPNPFRKMKRWVKRLFGMGGYICILRPANVDKLILSHTEVVWELENSENRSGSPAESPLIQVTTIGSDPENDVLTYNYVVSAGKIAGAGPNVVWDLTGVNPGSYTITAGVNDGCGVCGMTQTRRIEISSCRTCQMRETE